MLERSASVKKEILADAKGTLERHFGQRLPAPLDIQVHEEDAEYIALLHTAGAGKAQRIIQRELERVAGGTDVFVFMAVTAAVVTAMSVVGTAGAGLQASGTTHW